MTVYVRTGGNWRAASSGALYCRNGGSWRAANACYVKIGGVGAGYWYDSGYRGYPAVPSAPWVTGWDYSNINVGWSGGGGGAPVSYYQLQRLDVNGNQMNLDNYSGGQSNNYGVNWDSRYQFRVRSVSTGGLVSDWSGMLRPGIGHPQQDTYGYVQRTRAWSSAAQSGVCYRDDFYSFTVPNNIHLEALYWNNLRCGSGSSLVQRPSSNRWVYWVGNGSWQGPMAQGDIANGWTGGLGLDNFGNNATWGLGPTGQGWSYSNPSLGLYADSVQLVGTEYYDNWELTNRINEAGNYYW